MNEIQLYQGDCLEVMRDIPDGSIDAVITDPPYGCGITTNDPRAKSHWDQPVDIDAFTTEVARICTSFYAVFGQMPTLASWHVAATKAGFHYCEHVVWVKRSGTPMHRLQRSHESVLIYATKKGPRQFFQAAGPYEDVKLPGLLVDTYTVEGLDRYIKDLWAKAEGRSPKSRVRGGNLGHNKFPPNGRSGDRSPRTTNYTNVWSFLSPGQKRRGSNYEHAHPTQKPLAIMERLAEMLSPEGGSVLDPFAGSGTTGVACVNTGRSFIGIEQDAGYFKIAQERIAQAQEAAQQLELPLAAGAT